jgi:chromosomal replication initiation ATPase DnaA
MTQKKFFQHITKYYHKSNHYASNFILSDSNKEVFLYLEQWQSWHDKQNIIYGDEGSGKSHACKYWLNKTNGINLDLFNIYRSNLEQYLNKYNAFVIDDIEKYFILKNILHNLDQHDFVSFEDIILDIIDFCKSEGKYLLITTRKKISDLNVKMPDLISRLQGITMTELKAVEKSSLKTYLIELISYYQLSLPINILDFILNKSENYNQIAEFIVKIHEASEQPQVNINLALVKDFHQGQTKLHG